MNEKKLKRQMIRITIITIASSILLCLIGLTIMNYVFQAAYTEDRKQMQVETQEYKERIFKQLDKNLQILTTLSRAYEVSGVYDDFSLIGHSLDEVNRVNDFFSMSYLDCSGNGVMTLPDNQGWNLVTIDDFHPYAQEAIKKAIEGESAISKMFQSDVIDENLFVYAVPVYKNGEIIGVLSSSGTMEIFSDIANGNTVMGGKGYVHLINGEGKFLVRSENTLVKENMVTIFDGPYISGDTKEKTLQAMKDQKSIFGEFQYKNERCHFYMEPLNINGWYLFCANTVWSSVDAFWKVLSIAGITLFIILISVNVLLYSGYVQFRKNSKALQRIAYWDTVTGAENTLRFEENFKEVSEQKKPYSIVAINIHNFKGINDLFGKKQGNAVLCFVKEIIQNNLKQGEFFCRDAADLFYILLLDADEKIVTERVQDIIDSIRNVSTVSAEYSYTVALYAGIAPNGTREKALISMQSIQNAHQKSIALYNQDIHNAVRKKNSIESQMQSALLNREFKMFLQPKFRLATNELVGAEALVRWQNPDGSYHYPGEFIPLFEANGFCLKLDMYMAERVCEQIKNWKEQGFSPLPLSVNQSKLLFSDLKYPENLAKILEKYEVSPSLVTLEILEGIASNDLDHLRHQINSLHEKGFKISMDDFGTGYSSLNMLYQLEIDELKLDRGFLQEASEQDQQRRFIILEQVIQLAKHLHITTVVEGVETENDRKVMEQLGCELAQGYYYEKPLPADEFTKKYLHRLPEEQ